METVYILATKSCIIVAASFWLPFKDIFAHCKGMKRVNVFKDKRYLLVNHYKPAYEAYRAQYDKAMCHTPLYCTTVICLASNYISQRACVNFALQPCYTCPFHFGSSTSPKGDLQWDRRGMHFTETVLCHSWQWCSNAARLKSWVTLLQFCRLSFYAPLLRALHIHKAQHSQLFLKSNGFLIWQLIQPFTKWGNSGNIYRMHNTNCCVVGTAPTQTTRLKRCLACVFTVKWKGRPSFMVWPSFLKKQYNFDVEFATNI